MSDDRLFASNNPIGRIWYVINIIIIAALTGGVKFLFTHFIIPYATSDIFANIATWIMYVIYFGFILTFLSLVERRLFDVCGSRFSNGYKNVNSIIALCVFWNIATYFYELKHPQLFIPENLIVLICFCLDIVLLAIVFILAFIKGKLSDMSYEEYKRKAKYNDD